MVISFREQHLEPFISCALCSWRSAGHILMATQSYTVHPFWYADVPLHPDGGSKPSMVPMSFSIAWTVLTNDEWYKHLPVSALVGDLYAPTVTSVNELQLPTTVPFSLKYSYWLCSLSWLIFLLSYLASWGFLPNRPVPGMLPVSGWVPFGWFLWKEPRPIPRKPLIRQFRKYLPLSKETLRAISSLLSEDSSLNKVPYRIHSRSPDRPLNLYNFFWISPSSCQSYVENYYMWV